MNCFNLCILLIVMSLIRVAEFDSTDDLSGDYPEDDVNEIATDDKEKEETNEKPSEKSKGAIGQGFEIHKIDLLSKQLQATGAKIFESLPHEECTVTDKLGTTTRDDKFYSSTESLYQSVSTNSKIGVSLQGAYTLGASVAAVTNNIVSGNTQISGLSLNLKAFSKSHALKKECINKQPLAKELVKNFEGLGTKIDKPWRLPSWRKYQVFLEKYGSHIVKDVKSGSSIYQYVFAKSSEKFSQRDFTVKACVSLAGPTSYGKLGVSACSEVSKKEVETSTKKSMVKKLVIRGGKSETRASLSGELSAEQINKFLQEGQTDPSPILYSFYPIWTILKARYIGTEHYAKAVNLEQYYKGYLQFNCFYQETSNKKELQRFELSEDSDPKSPTYVCKLSPQGCRVDDDCHYEHAFWCSCSGESCVRYKDTKLNSGSTKRESYAYTGSGWGWQGCKRSVFKCYCRDPRTNWEESWSGDSDSALNDVNAILTESRRDKPKRHHL